MRNALRVTALAALLASVTAHAQMLALDTPTDPRSVAMGESFVAIPGTPAALMYNPAGIARVTGITAAYAQRQFNWISWVEDRKYYSATVTVHTPLFTLGAMYEREYYGEFSLTTPDFPDGVAAGKLYDDLFGLGAGISLGERIDVGVMTKVFDRSFNATGGSVDLKTTPAFMFDAGVIYRSLQAGNDQHLSELFTAGLSLQNFGTAMKSQLSAPGLEGQSASQTETSMPHYLRAGGSYSLTKPSGRGNGLLPFQLVLTGELRYLLNSGALETTNRLGAGVGGESLIYELLSIRLGVLTNPDNTEYATGGGMDVPVWAGVELPSSPDRYQVPADTAGRVCCDPCRQQLVGVPGFRNPADGEIISPRLFRQPAV